MSASPWRPDQQMSPKVPEHGLFWLFYFAFAWLGMSLIFKINDLYFPLIHHLLMLLGLTEDFSQHYSMLTLLIVLPLLFFGSKSEDFKKKYSLPLFIAITLLFSFLFFKSIGAIFILILNMIFNALNDSLRIAFFTFLMIIQIIFLNKANYAYLICSLTFTISLTTFYLILSLLPLVYPTSLSDILEWIN